MKSVIMRVFEEEVDALDFVRKPSLEVHGCDGVVFEKGHIETPRDIVGLECDIIPFGGVGLLVFVGVDGLRLVGDRQQTLPYVVGHFVVAEPRHPCVDDGVRVGVRGVVGRTHHALAILDWLHRDFVVQVDPEGVLLGAVGGKGKVKQNHVSSSIGQ